MWFGQIYEACYTAILCLLERSLLPYAFASLYACALLFHRMYIEKRTRR